MTRILMYFVVCTCLLAGHVSIYAATCIKRTVAGYVSVPCAGSVPAQGGATGSPVAARPATTRLPVAVKSNRPHYRCELSNKEYGRPCTAAETANYQHQVLQCTVRASRAGLSPQDLKRIGSTDFDRGGCL